MATLTRSSQVDTHSRANLRHSTGTRDDEHGSLSLAPPHSAVLELQELADMSDQVGALRGLQRLADAGTPTDNDDPGQLQAIASAGVLGSPEHYPHRSTIEAAFGRHDLDGIQAHSDPLAQLASTQLGACGYSLGSHVGFRSRTPSLFEATHEAVHYLQKRGGIELPEGVGRSGDRHERQANEIAGAVVEGRSVESSFDHIPTSGGGGGGGVQLLGETESLTETKSASIRVANRRASVSGTSGHSYAKYAFLTGELWSKTPFLRDLYRVIRLEHAGITNDTAAHTFAADNSLHFNRFAAEALKTARCMQFAEVVASRIVASQQNQWVYILGVDYSAGFGADHGWVGTSTNQIRTTGSKLAANLTQDELDDINIADAWDSFKAMNLGRYLRAQHNYFQADIRPDQVKVIGSHQGIGTTAFQQLFPNRLIGNIKAAVTGALATYKTDYALFYDRESWRTDNVVWDFERDKSNVNLEHDDAAYLWEMAVGIGRKKRKRAFQAWAADARGRRMDWRRPSARHAFHYLIDMRTFQVHARRLINNMDLANNDVPTIINGADLWRYVKKENLRRNTTTVRARRLTLVRAMSTQQHREMRTQAGTRTFGREVLPLLTLVQQNAL